MAMGVRPPRPGPWLQMFLELTEQLPHAVMICDMQVPGIKVTGTNAAGVRLVGYSKEEHIGRNCRFMQGAGTEAKAVRQIVSAIRQAKTTTVRVTNYKKDGTEFVNVLTLHPVHDSTRTYRYSIGLQAEAANDASEGAALEKLRSVLPVTFEAAAQPKKFEYDKLVQVDLEA